MTPRITAYHGDRDGIRWGEIVFSATVQRRWSYDRLADIFRLWRPHGLFLNDLAEDGNLMRNLEGYLALKDYEDRIGAPEVLR